MKTITSLLISSIFLHACSNSAPEAKIPPKNPIVYKEVEPSQTYGTCLIGEQTWMNQNLNEPHFKNGDAIMHAKTAEEWKKAGGTGTAAWCYYNNNSNFNIEHGKLYNFFTVLDYKNVCPSGWHVSTDEDWRELEVFLGMSIEESLYDSFNKGVRGIASNVGGKLKSTTGWEQNGSGTDAIGFNAKPSGMRDVFPGFISGYNVSFDVMNKIGHFWTASFDSNGKAWERILINSDNGVSRIAGVTDPSLGFNFNHSKNGYSIRCVQNN
jgi:uncharacterized protein (TIGR02145 family)